MIIGIDLQTLETNEAERGIGRCARGMAEHLARLCPQHKIVGFGFTDKPLPWLRCTDLPNFEYRRFELPHEREAYLADGILAPLGWAPPLRDLDLYLATSPLMPDILLPDGGPFPIVAVIHDLIPLVYRRSHPQQMSEEQWRLYDSRLDVIRDYDCYVSDSDASRADLCRLVGIAPERVCTVGVGVADEFFVRMDEKQLAPVREQCAISWPYVLTLTGHHYRKNWEGTFEIYASLPPADRNACQLVVVCRLDAPSRRDFLRVAEKLGVASRTVLADAVDDETLRGLYQGASALLFPSFYEGFGVPLVEAMAAEVPIVASDIAVFREVAGSAACFADPTRSDLMARELHRVLRDEPLRRSLIEEGRRQVQRYRWQPLIERAAAFFSDVAGRRLGKSSHAVAGTPDSASDDSTAATASAEKSVGATLAENRAGAERVAYFTLLPPQISGIADYNESLVRELAKHVRLELFLDDIEPAHPEIRENMVWHSSRDFLRLHRQRPYDRIVYHMGNNVLHGRQYRLATSFPGIVLLHDYSLRFFPPLCNRRFSPLELRDDIAHYYGLAYPRSMRADHIFHHLDLLDHPLNERLIERSLGLMVHSQWSRNRIHERFPDKPVEVLPFGVDRDPRRTIRPRAEIRQRYQISPDAFVVTCAGNLTPTKRLDTIVRGFAEVRNQVPDAVLCLVGLATDPHYFSRLHSLVADLGLADRVLLPGYVEIEELYDILDISDVCLNLRYPTLGETSAILIRMMYLGKAIIVSAISQFLEFPDSVCWKTDVDGAEQDQLVRYLTLLAQRPDLRWALGENARRYVESWTWDRVALSHIEAWRRIAQKISDER